MTLAGRRIFLISATLGAFVFGTFTGALATFQPSAEGDPAVDVSDTQANATPVEPQRIVLAAETDGQFDMAPSSAGAPGNGKDDILGRIDRGRIDQEQRQPDTTANARFDLQASARQNALQPTAQPQIRAITPEDPSAAESAEIASIATIAKAALTPRPWASEKLEVRQGDSLTTILKRAGIDGPQVHSALRSLKGVYDPRGLRAGQQLTVTAATREDQPTQLLSVALDLSFDHQLLITRDAAGSFITKTVEQAKRRTLVHRHGEIEDSLYLSARRVAMPNDVTDRLVRLFSWDVDFQRDIRQGDHFETLYEEVKLAKDESQVKGELVYAGLTLRGKLIDAYLYTPDGGLRTYYDSEGRSLRKFLLRTPIDGARLSSGFGMRKHPVLGYSRMHKGTDFAAPRGTPIYAGGSGKVEVAGVNGGYGNYVRIRHSDTWSTAYAHMHKFAEGLKPGLRVRQGDVIGYVGTTGRSTGNHLHYEVLKNGEQINPMKMKQPSASKLAGADLQAFQKEKARIDAKREQLGRPPVLSSQASASDTPQ